MTNINLDDLKRNASLQQQLSTTPEVLTQQVSDEMIQKTEQITPEERKKIDEIKESLNLLDSAQTVTYGVGAQKNLSDFSDSILNKIRNKDTGEIGTLLSDLMVQVKDMEIEDLGSKKGFLNNLPGISSLVKRMERFRAKYENVEVQIDRIEGQLDQTRVQMLKDIAMFDRLYEQNIEYFNQLQLYIIAGEELIQVTRENTIPKLRH